MSEQTNTDAPLDINPAPGTFRNTGVALSRERIIAAMQDCWNDYVSDSGCFPDDFTITGGPVLAFSAGRWAQMVADQLCAVRSVKAGERDDLAASLSRLQSENERLHAEYTEMALGRGAAHAIRKTAVEHAERAEERALKAEAENERLKAENRGVRVLIERVRLAEAERDQALEVVRELKWLRDAEATLAIQPVTMVGVSALGELRREYQRRKPLAWQAARLLSEKQ